MSWTDRFNNPGYKNWLRVGIALLATRDGLTNVTLQAATKLHAELLAKLGDSVENCTCNPKKGQECEDCKPWREELKTKYYTGDASRIGWTNCTPSKWSREPWEVAKVFMPKDPTADNTGPEKSDVSALLNFLIHCTYCNKYVSVKPSQKVIEVRNKAMHSKDLIFDQQTFDEYMGKMDRLLRLVKDPLTLAADITAQEAADEILKVKKGEFHIGAKLNRDCLDAEVRVLRDFMGEQEKLLELHKEQLEDHGTRLDTLEKRIPPVEEIHQMVGAVLDIINNNADLQSLLKDQAMALSTMVHQLQDRLDKVEGAVSQLEETVAEHGARIEVVNTDNARLHKDIRDVKSKIQLSVKDVKEVKQKLHQLETPSGSTKFSTRTDEQTSAFTSALAINYSNTLKTLKPLPWDDRFCLDLDKIFTRLVLVSHQGREAKGMFESLHHQVFYHQGQKARRMFESHHQVFDHQVHEARAMFESLDDVFDHQGHEARAMFESLDDVFDHQPESGQSKRFNVLVVGDAGSGKSTLLSMTALDWSCKKGRLADMNKIVLLIRLREVEPGESIAEIVWDQCVTKSAKGISISSIETCLQDYESDVVFLLDGYDELVPGAKGSKQAVPELLAKTWYPDCTVIVTSRPSSGIERYMAVDCEVNVIGFSSVHVDKYVPLYFQSVKKPDLADSLVKALKSKANIVARGLIQTPMFLVLICVLWEDNPTIVHFPVTMSGLYRELLTCVIKKYCVREGMSIPNDKIPPVVLTALHHLGKLALESLLRGESLVDLGKTTVNSDTDVMVNLGIVSKEVSASRLHPREQLNFPHKSMQEFLAARYVADRVNTSSGDLHSLVPLGTLSAVLHHRNLVQFICGCGGKVTSELLAHLSKPAMPFSECDELLFMLDEQSLIKHLCLMSLYEGQDSQHFPIVSIVLSSLDLKINIPSREGAALKFYLDHAMAVPEGRSLRLAVYEDDKGDAVEYLSTLVERSLPDLRLYLELGRVGALPTHISSMLDQLIPFLTNVPNISSLDLSSTSLTPESIQALRQILPKLTMLEELNLSNNPDIGDNGIVQLSKGFESDWGLKNVKLCGIRLGDISLKSLAVVLHHLSCLETLDLAQNNIGNEGLEPFAAIQQPVVHLKVLKLSHNKIGEVCLGSLVAVLHHLSCLENLDLTHNNIGNEGLVQPFAAIQQPVVSLKALHLSYNKIGDVCLGSLVAVLHHLSCLEKLDLSDNNIGDKGLEPFAAIQQTVASLTELNLSRNKIGDVCLGSLVAVLQHLSCLEELDLSKNNIGNEGKEPFAAIQQPIVSLIKVLDLSRNKIGDVCLGSLVAVLHHLSCLEKLDLSHNNIGDEGKEPFAAIQQPVVSLKMLRLSYNKIGDVCLGSLVAMLHHLSCLEELDLSHNNIGNTGLKPFAAIQQPGASLKVLRLSYNKIGDVCLGSLAAVLHHLSCLLVLQLSHNKIGDAEIASLAATLHHVPTLVHVILIYNPVTTVGLQRYAQTIHRMPALKGLSLDTQQTVHLDDTAAMSICTMLTQLPVLQLLSLRNISMQAAGLQAVNTAVEEHPTLKTLRYSRECVPQGVNIRSLSSKIHYGLFT